MPQVNTRRGTATTTAAQLVAADSSRTDLLITNEDSAIIIRIGPTGVANSGGTAADVGLAILPGQTLPLIGASQGGSAVAAAEWYVISDSGTPAFSLLEYGDFS